MKLIDGEAIIVHKCIHCEDETEHTLLTSSGTVCCNVCMTFYDIKVTPEEKKDIEDQWNAIWKAKAEHWLRLNPQPKVPELPEVFESEEYLICPKCNFKERYTPSARGNICLECKVSMIHIKIEVD